MRRAFPATGRRWTCLAALVLAAAFFRAEPAPAHEVLPAIADFDLRDGRLHLDIRINLEGIVAGIDLTAVDNTDSAPQAMDYDSLRALPPDAFETRFRAFWPRMAPRVHVRADGTDLPVTLDYVAVAEVGDINLPRNSTLGLSVALPVGTRSVEIGWAAQFGPLLLRQSGVDEPYDGYLQAGAMSPPIRLDGGDAMTPWQAFVAYVPIGFGHILPGGLDHILFVLGLFLLSTRLRPLLLQVSAFTLAHTVTLALGALGYVNLPARVVEPLIAASIVFIAVENIRATQPGRWRLAVVFLFGLLHGMGFAYVLGEYGLPDGAFFPALIGFNLGVELGQLFILAMAWLLVGAWFGSKPWYHARIATPASAAIAAVGAWWLAERLFFPG